MNEPIDIVVTYLNSKDKKWNEDFNYYKNLELGLDIQKESNKQAFGDERIRDWEFLKYWFRGVENNCSWVRKVFFIVQNENHVPEWLDLDNPKLRVVYHDEYIPEELLPTFNTMTIELYINRIKDLSNNYVICNDDFFFLNEIKEERFFRENKAVHQDNRVYYKYYDDNLGEFYQMLNNNMDLERKYGKKIKYDLYHLPVARKKDFESKILEENYDLILNAQKVSKFRNGKNYCACLYDDLIKICDEAILGNVYHNCKYIPLKSDLFFYEYENFDMVCFNDTEQLDDFNKTKEKLIEFLDYKFPKRSKYEK